MANVLALLAVCPEVCACRPVAVGVKSKREGLEDGTLHIPVRQKLLLLLSWRGCRPVLLG